MPKGRPLSPIAISEPDHRQLTAVELGSKTAQALAIRYWSRLSRNYIRHHNQAPKPFV